LENFHKVTRAYDNLGELYLDMNGLEEETEHIKKAVAILTLISAGKSEISPDVSVSGPIASTGERKP
jgi:hypothetical protein